MRKSKCFLIAILLISVIISLVSCMPKIETPYEGRAESDIEYIEKAKKYVENKYGVSATVLEYNFPLDGFNDSALNNQVVFKDENGVLFNVRTNLSSPYDYYDDYVDARASAVIDEKINSETLDYAEFKTYAFVKNQVLQSIDISAENISSVTIIGAVTKQPDDEVLLKAFEVYQNACKLGYEKFYFRTGFFDCSKRFEQEMNNYTSYLSKPWEAYDGNYYGHLSINDQNLSFEEFKGQLTYTAQ